MSWKKLFTAMAVAGIGCNASLEDPAFEDTGTARDALTESVTQTVTLGQCATTLSLDTTPSGFSATCASKCLNPSSVTLRLYIQQLEGTSWRDGVMSYTGFAAKTGGSTTVQWPNASPGSYRGHCNVDFVDPNQNHSTADLFTASMEQARTSDVTPPEVVMTSPQPGSYSGTDTLTLSADASDNVAVQKVEFYRDTSLVTTDLTAPYSTSFTLKYLAPGTYSFFAKAYDAMGNVRTSAPVTVTRQDCVPASCAAQGKNCGSLPDGCGNSLFCGVCSGSDVCGGRGVANVCATPPDALITLNVSGRAQESVASNPSGLSVLAGQAGSARFANGTSVTLTASNGRVAVWSGACSSNGAKTRGCTFTATTDATVSANIQ